MCVDRFGIRVSDRGRRYRLGSKVPPAYISPQRRDHHRRHSAWGCRIVSGLEKELVFRRHSLAVVHDVGVVRLNSLFDG
jgi:hypothetical protein